MGKNGASLAAQMVKNPPTIQETWVQYLGCKDALEMPSQRVRHD